MPTPRILFSTLACAVFLLTAYGNLDSRATLSAQPAAKVGNPITGEGLPNPAPKVTRNWGELPAGRKWGTSAGLDTNVHKPHPMNTCGSRRPPLSCLPACSLRPVIRRSFLLCTGVT